MNYFRGHFFQISRQYEMHFVMHDLLNDLAKYVCGDFCFIFDDEESHNILKMTRHFSFFNVVSLKLSNCENIVLLPPLGILPSLKNLWITGLSGIVVIGGEFYGNGSNSSSEIIPFVSLQTLSFKDMKGWEEWDCKTVPGAFSCLQKLSIQNCPNLKECLLQHLPRLMKLEISYCQHLVSFVSFAPAIHKLELFNCGKLQIDYHQLLCKFSRLVAIAWKKCCLNGLDTLYLTPLSNHSKLQISQL
ncbi:unnamed protein product [Vicia faba]|uniref:Leucine-rich repeat domain, L domain-containing protein n=1 Tax=Vicia faba TaxID=3906 RepID=A0AAV1AEJ3_VICFA|nr:unnamed protein product [Vicia faba]